MPVQLVGDGPLEPPKEFKLLADEIRKFADCVERGEILAFAWLFMNKDHNWVSEWIKVQGLDILLIQGALQQMQHDIAARDYDAAEPYEGE